MGTFNHVGDYVCECGKTFTNSQQFNSHKSWCEVRLGDDAVQKHVNNSKEALKRATQLIIERSRAKRENLLHQWINEQHMCEKCGKVMTEKFGTGRFCSKSCANSRQHSDDTKQKISKSLNEHYGNTSYKAQQYECIQCGKKFNNKDLTNNHQTICNKCTKLNSTFIYDGPDLPYVEESTKEKGYFSRSQMSYPEKFWKLVLENNDIQYQHDYIVQLPKGKRGVYRLDFLVDNFDIEIDGQFHLEESCKIKDQKRTEYLETLGYIVYRIQWINPINELNKQIVNKQIDDLFEFIGRDRLK